MEIVVSESLAIFRIVLAALNVLIGQAFFYYFASSSNGSSLPLFKSASSPPQKCFSQFFLYTTFKRSLVSGSLRRGETECRDVVVERAGE